MVTRFRYETLLSRVHAACGTDEEEDEEDEEDEEEEEEEDDDDDEDDEDDDDELDELLLELLDDEEEDDDELLELLELLDEELAGVQTAPVICGTSAAALPLVPCSPNSIVWFGWMVWFQLRWVAV